MIASAGVTLVNLSFSVRTRCPQLADVDLIAVLLFAAALFVLRRWKKDPILVMAGRGRGGACAVYAAVRHCARMAKPPRTATSGAVFALYGSGMPQERPGRASQKTCREAPDVPSVPRLRAFCNSIACSVFP